MSQEIAVPHELGRPLLIVNPRAGNDRRQTLPRLREALRVLGVEHDVRATARPGDATVVARRAVLEQGRRYVVAVGGDGTLHEVVNGLVDADTGLPHDPDVVLGVVGAGTGSDFARTFGLDREPEELARHLAGHGSMRVDLGRVRVRHGDGTRTVLFANVAQAGFGGLVVSTARRVPRRLGPARYPLAMAVAWARFRRVPTTVAVDGGTRTEPLCNVLVANGEFLGGGLRVAPRAVPSDGLVSVQAWGGKPWDLLRAWPLLRHGGHLARPDVREWQSREVTVDAARPLVVEADGEVLGTTPARFDVLRQVLTLKL